MDFREWLKDDYYNLLGVSQTSGTEVINKAYRQQAKNCHPDVYPLNSIERYQAEQKFKKILQAKETLIDPVKRSKYDNERQLLQDCYLSSMSNAYNFQAFRTETTKTKETDTAIYNTFSAKDYFKTPQTKEDKSPSYKKQGAKRYYAMCLKAVGSGDYNRAWIYFQSAKSLEPSLQMPPALWALISKARYSV